MMKFDSETFWVQLHDLPLRYMDKCHGTQIGNAIGRVVDVDVDMDVVDTGWRNYLRVRIKISLNKTLATGRFVILKEESL